MNFLRRTSSRIISGPAQACQQRRHSLWLSAATAAASTTNANPSILRTIASAAISTTPVYDKLCAASHISSLNNNITTRSKHSSTQIKRLFKKNPARRRIALRDSQNNPEDEDIIPEGRIQPIISEPKIFLNGWNAPLEGGGDVQIPDYPFQIARTKNKPNNAVGFLPVYAEFR